MRLKTLTNVMDLQAGPPIFLFTAIANNIGAVQAATNDLFEIQNGEITESNRLPVSYNSVNGQLTVGAHGTDLALTASFVTAGTGNAFNRFFIWRDITQPVGANFGAFGRFGVVGVVVPATAIVPAGTSITLDVRSLSSAENQRLQAGSFINVQEV